MLFIDDLFIPDEDRIGEEGKGFKYLLAGLNAERIIVAGGCLGMGRAALRRATEYVKQRVVFGRPIGMNQGIQFPLADSLAKLDAVELLIRKAAWMYDNGMPCAKEANEAKYLASSWAFEACDRAMQVHGGYGYTSEYHVERYWRESRVQRIAPISNELVLAYLGREGHGAAPRPTDPFGFPVGRLGGESGADAPMIGAVQARLRRGTAAARTDRKVAGWRNAPRRWPSPSHARSCRTSGATT